MTQELTTDKIYEFQNLDGCIRTFTGKKFSFIDPQPDQIDIIDIAKGLAYRGHFVCQTPKMFSIAQHCLMVVDLMPADTKVNRPELALAGLLHDAEEFVTGDIPKPWKNCADMKPVIEKYTNLIRGAIFEKFDLQQDLMKEVKPYDVLAQAKEYDQFHKGIKTFKYMEPDEAYNNFINTFGLYSYWKQWPKKINGIA